MLLRALVLAIGKTLTASSLYDGIIAGAPGSELGHGLAAGRLWLASGAFKDSASAIPRSLYPVIHAAVGSSPSRTTAATAPSIARAPCVHTRRRRDTRALGASTMTLAWRGRMP
jgi:hypothetical protein